MKADTTNLLKFIKDANGHLLIPLYQRDYSWEKEQCSRLLQDIINIGKNTDNSKSYFLGSMVFCKSDPITVLNRDLTIIDGQQRLITITLLILGLYKFIKEEINSNALDSKLKATYNRLLEDYEHCIYYRDVFKLVPNEKDREVYNNIVNQVFDPENTSNNNDSNNRLKKNYEFLSETIGNNSTDFISIIRGLKRLVIATIQISNSEDPQLVFESVNSKGLKLSTYDIIKLSLLSINDDQEDDDLDDEDMQDDEQEDESMQDDAPANEPSDNNNYADIMEIDPKSVTHSKPANVLIEQGAKTIAVKVNSWADVYYTIVSSCYKQDAAAVKRSYNIYLNTAESLSFSHKDNNLENQSNGKYSYRKLDENTYLRLGYSAERIITILKDLINSSLVLQNTNFYISF